MLKLTGKASDFLQIAVKAAAKNDLTLVKEILRIKPEWLFHIGSHGRTMLWEACHRGKLDMVKFLVGRGADINACGTHYTPYFVELSCYCIAKYKKHFKVADYLLDKGAVQTIHSAAFLGDIDLLRSMLKINPALINQGKVQHIMAGKNIDGVDFIPQMKKWATPLCYALRGGDLATATVLVGKGAQIVGIEAQLFTAADDDLDMLRLLLSNGADPFYAPRVSPTEKDAYKLLSEFGVQPITTKELSEELVYLCRGDRGGNPAEAKQLLASGADINHQDNKGKTALHRAARSGFLETMKILIDEGAKIDHPDVKGETALFEPVRSSIKNKMDREDAFKLLIQNGADLNHENNNGETVIDVANGLGVNWGLMTQN